MSDTAKNYAFDKAPKQIELFGDKSKKRESASHIIEFPGGAIEVSRTSEGNYWAHIIVNRGFAGNDGNGLTSARGEVLQTRIDSAAGVNDVPNTDTLTQVAVLIRSVNP